MVQDTETSIGVIFWIAFKSGVSNLFQFRGHFRQI